MTELHPELAASLTDTPSGVHIKHPYVDTPYVAGLEATFNEALERKAKAIAAAQTERRWHLFIMLHERPWRLDPLIEVSDRLTDAEFWDMVGYVWTDSDNITQNGERWDRILRTQRPGHEAMMDESERLALAALPEVVTVYQGHTDQRDDGWSWTTSYDTAVWFARRFAAQEGSYPQVTTASVARDNVLAYLFARSEYEILAGPEHVTIVSTVEVQPDSPAPTPAEGTP